MPKQSLFAPSAVLRTCVLGTSGYVGSTSEPDIDNVGGCGMLLAVAARRAGRLCLTACLQEPQAIGVLRLNIRPVAAPRGPPCTPRPVLPESGSACSASVTASLARRPVCTTSILFSDLPQRLLGSATSASFAERLDAACSVLHSGSEHGAQDALPLLQALVRENPGDAVATVRLITALQVCSAGWTPAAPQSV